MKDEPIPNQSEPESTEPALTPLGTPREPPIRSREGDIIHTAPEFAVGEGDVRSADIGAQEPLRGTSLWKDAWRRLLKNKLAVFGMIVVAIIALVSIIGPFVIQRTEQSHAAVS
jgi:N-terminal TM domain of oligopeptide transport permease C